MERVVPMVFLLVLLLSLVQLLVSLGRSLLLRRQLRRIDRRLTELHEIDRLHAIHLVRRGCLLRARFEPPGDGARA